MAKSHNGTPYGGKYTRPRRGFRAKSNYRIRLKKRGITRKDVRMPSLDELRKRQRDFSSGLANSTSNKRLPDRQIRNSLSRVQVPVVRTMAPNHKRSGGKSKDPKVEQYRNTRSKEAIR